MLQSHTEYVTVPPGEVRESLRTIPPVTQITPGFGVGLLVGDFDGLGDFDGVGDFDGLGDFEGDGLLDGVVLLDGLGVWVGLELFVGLGVPDAVGDLVGSDDFDGVGEALGVLVGLALREMVGRGLIEGVFRPDEIGLEPVSGIRLAPTACADAVPQTAVSSGLIGAAMTGATAGPDTRNRPAPAATAACPTRTILTGTAALR